MHHLGAMVGILYVYEYTDLTNEGEALDQLLYI